MSVDACTLVIHMVSQLLNGHIVTALLLFGNQLAAARFIHQLEFCEKSVVLCKFVC